MYAILTTVHLVAIILVVGNVTITSFWKVLIDWTGNPFAIGHAQKAVAIADWIFTVPGLLLLIGSGYWLAFLSGADPFRDGWLIVSQLLFVVSGLIWLLILVPIQIRQYRRAEFMMSRDRIPPRYWKDANTWIWWGIIATVPLVGALYCMIEKPVFV